MQLCGQEASTVQLVMGIIRVCLMYDAIYNQFILENLAAPVIWVQPD